MNVITNKIVFLLVCLLCTSFSVLKVNANELSKFQHRFSFIIFYMHSCPHCQRFDPVLKKYSEQTHISVLPFTLDRHSLPSFPDSVTPTQIEVQKYFPMNNVVVPTLFIADSRKHRIYPVLQGEATFNQLSQRVREVIGTINQASRTSINVPAPVSPDETQEFSYGAH